MPNELRLYEAHIEFQTSAMLLAGTATHTTIHFKAKDPEEAAQGCFLWFRNRHIVMDDYFNKLCCIKIYTFNPQEFQADGFLPPETGLPCYEWKAS